MRYEEECDDGNTDFGDGCSLDCNIEDGYECPIVGLPCHLMCADGGLDSGEECDDGNTDTGDGCSEVC